jgi:beta-xylosidase
MQSYILKLIGKVFMTKTKDKSIMHSCNMKKYTVDKGIQSMNLRNHDARDKFIFNKAIQGMDEDEIEELRSHSVIRLRPIL